MFDEIKDKDAFERAASAVYENYNGVNTWVNASKEARSLARQSIRRMLSALNKNGLELSEVDSKESGASTNDRSDASSASLGPGPRITGASTADVRTAAPPPPIRPARRP